MSADFASAKRPFGVLLDLSRLISRVGRGPHTGIDRVELAYLRWCLATPAPLQALVRTAAGFSLLDRAGVQALLDRIEGRAAWGNRDLRAFVGVKTARQRGRAESDVRRLAVASCGKGVLRALLGAKLVEEIEIYLNAGHSNISDEVCAAVRPLKIAVFLHDAIPLDFPQYQRRGTVQAFAEKLRIVSKHADSVITNSETSLESLKAHMGDMPEVTVAAHLGVDAPAQKSTILGINRPFFVTLGTIEPRKNHALLLDVWDALRNELDEDDMPVLHIVGQRGWENAEVFLRLDALKDDAFVIEHPAMEDRALWQLIGGAQALLFPSEAEGFGLPSLEAAALGVPVVCGDLAIHRELLGAYPIYAGLDDLYRWKKTIKEQAGQRLEDLRSECAARRPHIPSWPEHFERVSEALLRMR